MQPATLVPPPKPPLTPGRIVALGVVALLGVSLVLTILGVSVTSSASCDAMRRDIEKGRSTTAAAQRYYSDCK